MKTFATSNWAALCFILVIWEVTTKAFHIPEYLLPSPSDVLQSLIRERDSLAAASGVTLLEAIGGLTLALLIATFSVSVMLFVPIAKSTIHSMLLGLQSVPILAIAPLLTLWFGTGYGSKIAASCLVSFFPLLTGWLAGLDAVERDELDLFRIMNATQVQAIRWLLIPRSLPYFFGGLRVSAPLAILGALVGEFVGAQEGLGFRILTNSYYVKTSDMFAYISMSAFLGILAHYILVKIEQRVLFWHGRSREAVNSYSSQVSVS